MTLGALPGVMTGRCAMATGAIGSPGVVKRSAIPLAGVVASGALDGKVAVFTMATGAGDGPLMIERNVVPIIGDVAKRALGLEMQAGRMVLVARLAVVSAGVVKPDPTPLFGVVAEGALTRIVLQVGWRVAGLAVAKTVVIEPRLLPIIVVVAVGALRIIVIFWAVLLGVALLAIIKALVVKPRLLPVINVVTPGALSLVMVFWYFLVFRVALLAIGQPRVIKGDGFPIVRAGMAVHAHGRNARLSKRCGPHHRDFQNPGVLGRYVMVFRAILHVAGTAHHDIGVLVSKLLPIIHAGMTRVTRANVMVNRGLLQVARFTFDDAHVIERKRLPTVFPVAVLALASKVVGVKSSVLVPPVATGAFCRRVSVQAVLVTGDALYFQVLADERVNRVVIIFVQKGNPRRGKRGAFDGHHLFDSFGLAQRGDLELQGRQDVVRDIGPLYHVFGLAQELFQARE